MPNTVRISAGSKHTGGVSGPRKCGTSTEEMRMNKYEADDYIKLLADRYPACFVEYHKNRRPLKKNIIDDLRQRERTWDEYTMEQVLHFYTQGWGYLYNTVAGALRIDLDG